MNDSPTSDILSGNYIKDFLICKRLFYIKAIEGVEQEGDFGNTADKYLIFEDDQLLSVRFLEEISKTIGFMAVLPKIHLSSVNLGASISFSALKKSDSDVELIPIGLSLTKDISIESSILKRFALIEILCEEYGYVVPFSLYLYPNSKKWVEVRVSEQDKAQAIELLSEIETLNENKRPLVDGVKPYCNFCSVSTTCLPDETESLTLDTPITKARITDTGFTKPVYLSSPGSVVTKQGERLEVTNHGELIDSLLIDEISQLCIFGPISITTPAVSQLLAKNIDILYFSTGGWFKGLTTGLGSKNIRLRTTQYKLFEQQSLELSKELVRAKILNSRVVLMRNAKPRPTPEINSLFDLSKKAMESESLAQLLGIEGFSARLYFTQFQSMLKSQDINTFNFESRNRRPPQDPVNCLLSYTYALVLKDQLIACLMVGMDPYLGFYHTPKYARPALALDLMEPLRPIIADSVVISLINRGEIVGKDFDISPAGVFLTPQARKKVILSYEKRMQTMIIHPRLNYKITYRRLLELQVRLLASYILQDIPSYQSFVVR